MSWAVRLVAGPIFALRVSAIVLAVMLFADVARARTSRDDAPQPDAAEEASDVSSSAHWCAPTLTKLTSRLCYYSPSRKQPTSDAGTLVIFLHSLVSAAPMAAWEQQQRMQRLADTYGFSILVPQGRPGLGPGRSPDVLAWPTAQELQAQHEAELLAEWQAGVNQAQALHGNFARVFLIGFSNGAYYATSLTFRERFACDGVAVFAGGSGSKYQRLTASRAKRRTPMFVGYGTLDPDNKQQRALVSLLETLGWPHRALAAKVGHTVASEQMRAALRFLRHPNVE